MDAKTFSIPVRENLVLRFIQPEEAEALFALVDRNRAYLRERLNWVDKETEPRNSLETIQKRIEAATVPKRLEFGIYLDSQLVGSMGFNEISMRNKFGEIGYWLTEELQGQSIMTDCVRALVTYGFAEVGLNRIEIRCSPTNLKSEAIPKKLGFTYEGTARGRYFLYDHFEDSKVYSMLASEWKN